MRSFTSTPCDATFLVIEIATPLNFKRYKVAFVGYLYVAKLQKLWIICPELLSKKQL